MSDPQTLELHATDNPRIWAEMFCEEHQVNVEDPVATMTTWFANAIETGRQHASPESR